MNSLHRMTYGAFQIGAYKRFGPDQIEHLVSLFNRPTRSSGLTLGGRTSVTIDTLDGVGPVAVKHYRRGGLVHLFVKQTYLRRGKTRCRLEYEMLDKVRRMGVDAPKPLAYATRGKLFYRCWLVSREVPAHSTLAELSISDINRAIYLIEPIAQAIGRLIQNRILHVDLHPGNVLVDPDNRTYLIDFDRAGSYRLGEIALRNRYLARWKRAVIKHRLPNVLWKEMQVRLLGNHTSGLP